MPLIPSGTRAVIVTCLVFVGVALALPVAQQPPPTFRTGVEAVVLDVSVLDQDRRPVRGLTAADFTILEDGKPQDIRTFKALDLEDVVETLPAPWVREVAPDVRRNDEFKGHRVVVIVLDDATLAGEDVLLGRRLGRTIVDQLPPDDIAAVVYTLKKDEGQVFTKDRARLRAAVERLNGSGSGSVHDEAGDGRHAPTNRRVDGRTSRGPEGALLRQQWVAARCRGGLGAQATARRRRRRPESVALSRTERGHPSRSARQRQRLQCRPGRAANEDDHQGTRLPQDPVEQHRWLCRGGHE